MRILFNDLIQTSDAPASFKSPSLAETTEISGPLVITLQQAANISAVGIGNTDGTSFEVVFNDTANTQFNFTFNGNGLYSMPDTVTASRITITTNATFIGRIGAGKGIKLCTAIAKQPGWNSTSEPRTTLSGQIVPGAGGYNYRTLSLDTRYKMNQEAVEELQAGYKNIGLGYPFFIDLAKESYKLTYSRLYAIEKDQRTWSIEGGIMRFLYSYRFNFIEAF
jgi:hypothetical protein